MGETVLRTKSPGPGPEPADLTSSPGPRPRARGFDKFPRAPRSSEPTHKRRCTHNASQKPARPRESSSPAAAVTSTTASNAWSSARGADIASPREAPDAHFGYTLGSALESPTASLGRQSIRSIASSGRLWRVRLQALESPTQNCPFTACLTCVIICRCASSSTGSGGVALQSQSACSNLTLARW